MIKCTDPYRLSKMEVKKELLKPFFNGYKLTFDDAIKLEFYPLEASVKGNELNPSLEYQIMADKIYENKLKSSRESGLLYYISSEGNLISFSRETLKSSTVYAGPIDSFALTENDLIVVMKEKYIKIQRVDSLESFMSMELEICGNEFKLLKTKMLDDNSLIILIQSIGKVEDFNREADEQLSGKTGFGFYRVEVKVNECESNCKLLGWSLSRPLVTIIQSCDNILLGTSTGIMQDGQKAESTSSIEAVETGTGVFDEEDEDEQNEILNNCRFSEFVKNDSSNTQYQEFTIASGTCVNELHVPVKYLYDVIVYDFSNRTNPEHVSTFSAINFIQNGKIDKKFTVFGDKYAFIIETNGNIYCYAKPEADSSFAAQYLIQLDDEEEVMGWAHESKDKDLKEILYLLAKKKIYKLEI